jgi:hypothetical protein
MQRLLPDFFKERLFRGFFFYFFISLLIPFHSSASCVDLLKIRELIKLNNPRSKSSDFDANQVDVLGRSERYNSHEKIEIVHDFQKPPKVVVGLEQKVYGKIRSEDQISAWFQNIAGRFKEIRAKFADAELTRAQSTDPRLNVPPTSLMSIEEFLGLLDGAFASEKYPLAKILKDFDIKQIRFVDGKSFDANQKMWITRLFKKNEIVLEVPNVDFENRLEAALWMKGFIVTLHEAARKYVSSALDDSSNMLGIVRRFNLLSSSDKPTAEELWNNDSGDGTSFKKKTKKLDYAVGDMLQELTDYIENLTSGSFSQNELVKLTEKNFQYQKIYPFVNLALEANTFSKYAPFTAFINTHPLYWYEPSRIWLEGKRAIRLERLILQQRMDSYFSRRKRTSFSNVIGYALAGASVYNYVQQGSPLDLDNKKEELLKATEKLNSSEENLLGDIKSLQVEYAQLKKVLNEAETAKDDTKVIETNKKMSAILQRLEALDIDK